MKLSRTERLILSNQYRILAALEPGSASEHNEARDILESGYEGEYSSLCNHIHAETLSAEECSEVVQIMSMHSALKRGYDGLEDKGDLDPASIEFDGFDGNNETKQMAYARFFCNQAGGRFSDIHRGDNFNSHCPTLDRYRRMLQAWEESDKKYKLTQEDITRIVAAGLSRR